MELLVVIGIMATLASVALPAVGRFVRPGRDAAADSEFVRVQAAMDMYIAENPPPIVPLNGTPAGDFSATTPALYPLYMRDAQTLCDYTWDATGRVSQTNCP